MNRKIKRIEKGLPPQWASHQLTPALIDWLIECTFTASLLLQLLHICLLFFLTLLLPQPWHMYLRWYVLALRAALLNKRDPPFPMTNSALNDLVSPIPGFSKSCWNFAWSCDCLLVSVSLVSVIVKICAKKRRSVS